MSLQQIPDGSWVTADGRWHWVNDQWAPLPPAAAGPPGILWFTSAPHLLVTVLINGLIGLIPIAGTMNLYGYALVTARNLRAGYRVLPPANLSYLGRGAPATVLLIAWSVVAFVLGLIVGGVVAVATYGSSHDWAWTIALGVAAGITASGLANIANLPFLVPTLELSDRVGWGVFHVGRLTRHALGHWRSMWFGLAVLAVWYVVYFALAVVVSFVPLGGLLAAIVGLPVMTLMIAVPLARFDDPPPSFTRGVANAVAAGWLAIWVIGTAFVWTVGIVSASLISSHPDEVACFFDSGCNFAYTGSLETITHVSRSSADPTLVTVDVTFINRSGSAADVIPSEYSARTTSGMPLAPSPDCTIPTPASVPSNGRLQESVCFQLPNAQSYFDVHIPWTGWDYRTGQPPYASPSPASSGIQ
jgi:ABC-type amino acid transport system permease subunit